MKIERESNMELLRITSMLMVLSVHSFYPPITNGGYLTLNDLSVVNCIDFFRESISIPCVNIFVLISGYFSIKWKLKGIISLIFQVYFWIFILYIFVLAFGLQSWSIKSLSTNIIGLFSSYWFITSYIGLYVLSPMINCYVSNVSKNELQKFLVVFFIFQFICQFHSIPNSFLSGYSVLSFVGLYLLGRYVRLYGLGCIQNLTMTKLFMIYIVLSLLITFSSLSCGIVLHMTILDLKQNILIGWIYNNPLTILQTIVIFVFFQKIHIENKVINYFGGSALSVYLLHLHPNIKGYYIAISEQLYDYSLSYHYLILLILFISIFLIAIPVDKFRVYLFNNLYNLLASRVNMH